MTEWSEVLAGVTQSLGGGRDAGRARMLAAWDGAGPGEHAPRCVLAHYLADLEPALADEVAWDEVALREHAYLADDALAPVGIPSAAALAPSLHLNLGDGYRRQGRITEARRELEAAETTAHLLGDDGYGELLRGGIERLRARLDAGDD
ncbi:hypothetical protein [Phycicoccus sp. DTK01]|uniref:hypothetical protein n=1 Tax=Phycicoccus sp. DTK01 TaxID=2785745 RepID=UPI001A8C745A|nr:hypothetical protein [Phycicoccus sp. DTK01]GIL35333.1 hypothetical protein PDTK01_14090 [Phycicoccus sp. DTK01]